MTRGSHRTQREKWYAPYLAMLKSADRRKLAMWGGGSVLVALLLGVLALVFIPLEPDDVAERAPAQDAAAAPAAPVPGVVPMPERESAEAAPAPAPAAPAPVPVDPGERVHVANMDRLFDEMRKHYPQMSESDGRALVGIGDYLAAQGQADWSATDPTITQIIRDRFPAWPAEHWTKATKCVAQYAEFEYARINNLPGPPDETDGRHLGDN